MDQEINFDFLCLNQLYSKNTQSVVLVFQEKKYRISVPHYLITLQQLKFLLSQKLSDQGIKMDSDTCYCLDQSNNELQEKEVIQNFIHKVQYVQIIQLNLIRNQLYIFNIHEIDYYLTQNLKKNEFLSLQQISRENMYPFKAFPKKNALQILKIFIIGPIQTPYQGGVFEIECDFQDDYPYTPRFMFKTPIYHLNIVCGDVPIDFKVEKDPTSIVLKAIQQILNLLQNPQFELVLNVEIAEQYQNNLDIYNSIAENYTIQYAQPTIDELVQGIISDVNSESNNLKKELQEWIQQQQGSKKKNIFTQLKRNYEDYNHELQMDQYIQQQEENFYQNLLHHKDQIGLENITDTNGGIVDRFSTRRNNCLITKKQITDKLYTKLKNNEQLSLQLILESESYKQDSLFKVFPLESYLNVSKFFFFGPKNSPYEGGIFQVTCIMKDDFPFSAPGFSFKTQIYHPNFVTGQINETFLQWTPVLGLKDAIVQIINLLCEPIKDNCLNRECAIEYLIHENVYQQKAQAFTQMHANPSIKELVNEVIGESWNHELILSRNFEDWIKYWRSV